MQGCSACMTTLDSRLHLCPGVWVPWLCGRRAQGCVRYVGVVAHGHTGIYGMGTLSSGVCGHSLCGGFTSPSLSRWQHSNTEFASVAALLAHYSGPLGGCFCRLAPGHRNPGYEERDSSSEASASARAGEAAWAPAAPIGVQHERG